MSVEVLANLGLFHQREAHWSLAGMSRCLMHVLWLDDGELHYSRPSDVSSSP